MKVRKRGAFVIVLALFALFISLSSTATIAASGCYVYPQASEDLYCAAGTSDTQAQADCRNHQSCEFSRWFIPNSDCQSVPECREVTCSTDCQLHAQGICQQRGGTVVPENQYNYYCSPGCCKLADRFCQFGLNKNQCEQRAQQLGLPLPPSPPTSYFVNPIGMTLSECNQQYCQVQIASAELHGVVFDDLYQSLSGVVITLDATHQATSAQDGSYAFLNLPPSTYILNANKESFAPFSATISMIPAQVLDYNLTLTSATALAVLSGTVRQGSSSGLPLGGATIAWSGPTLGQLLTDAQGHYQIPALPSGQYRLIASKVGFTTQEQTIVLGAQSSSAGSSSVWDFVLTPATLQGVTGVTFIDTNNNGHADAGENTYGVRLYVDGVFRGYSTFPDGAFTIGIQVSGNHTLSAAYQQYQLSEQQVTLIGGQQQSLNSVLLTTYVGECSATAKNIGQFSLSSIPGSSSIHLEWQKPCAEVIGYAITRNGQPFASASPAQNTLIDDSTLWGASYTYGITALYDQHRSSAETARTIIVGNAACENHYDTNTHDWDNFCLSDDASRKNIYTCTNDNQLVISSNCGQRDGGGSSYFCSRLSSSTATCKDAGSCTLLGDPFGLYFSRNQCYGTYGTNAAEAQNYCYYDYSKTIVNSCSSCATIHSCFDYQSKDACTTNNCFSAACQWVDGAANSAPTIDYNFINLPGVVSTETGHGYCAPSDYKDDDRCSVCSATGNLFENYYCTAQVCSSLGRCFANTDLSACSTCGDTPSTIANCYTYNTEQECTGSHSTEKNVFGEIMLSKDRCNWQRCAWRGPQHFTSGGCVKDGNADTVDDCADITNAAERALCRVDVSPPHTSLSPLGITTVSFAQPNLTFVGDDGTASQASQRNPMGRLSYCLTSADSHDQNTCTNFVSVWYPQRLSQETVTIDLLHASFIDREINGKTLKVVFYSEDKYHNQEEPQQAFVFFDNVPPQFTLNHQATTTGDRTQLVAYTEGQNEPMACTFALTGILPTSSTQTQTLPEETKEATFDNLPGVLYDINTTCVDHQGNHNTQSQRLVFDLEKRIDIISPAGNVHDSSLAFRASTVAGASCSLYHHQEKVTDFISDEDGKNHHTSPIPGLVEGPYTGEYSIVCRDLLTPEQYEDYFDFTLDFTPPNVQIVLKEGAREERPIQFGWQQYFISAATADFECRSEGFTCNKVFYCLGDACDTIQSSSYHEYTQSVMLQNSTKICYYADDQANNRPYSPVCGEVKIEGYGITLEQPTLHYFQNQQWGVSNTPSFLWKFRTKVPTSECRFDFTSGFNYDNVPGLGILQPNLQLQYHVAEFPNQSSATPYPVSGGIKTVYVRCKNAAGEIGPEEIMNLEYDPTAPQIIEAKAIPPLLLEGSKVDLSVKTDDTTLCKYSASGQTDYAAMGLTFPGAEDQRVPILSREHLIGYYVNSFVGLNKEFSFPTQCRNGAGELSSVSYLNFTVDYSQLGAILSIWPAGELLTNVNVTLLVQTSKNALCEYRDITHYLPLQGAGTKEHRQQLSNITEGFHQIPVRCTMGDHRVEALSQFTLDLSPPLIKQVDDGNLTCGQNVGVYVSTNEQNISRYAYQLYDRSTGTIFRTNSTNRTNTTTTSSGSLILVTSDVLAPTLPLSIPATNLIEGHSYFVRVRANDTAGWLSQPFDSDGVLATAANATACRTAEAPHIEILEDRNSTCISVGVRLACTDAVGCKDFMYGLSSSQRCTINQSYTGQNLALRESNWLCYAAKNNAGKNVSGETLISFDDTDGDGIRNSCDTCVSAAGKVVNEQGCASGETPMTPESTDEDNDHLPDSWERLYSSEQCPLLPARDSDNNGIPDADEDYDHDGYTNYQEYINRQDPCHADAPQNKTTPTIQNQLQNKTSFAPPVADEQATTNILPWVLLILGVILLIFGSGYLIYYYRRDTKKPASLFREPSFREPSSEPEAVSENAPWKKKLLQLKKSREMKNKQQQRQQVFSEFHQGSTTIPHLNLLLQKKTGILPKLAEVARTYSEHKDEIKPGLRDEEKGVFAKLENLAEKTKEQKLRQVVNKEEAQTIFQQLKDLAKKRKQ